MVNYPAWFWFSFFLFLSHSLLFPFSLSFVSFMYEGCSESNAFNFTILADDVRRSLMIVADWQSGKMMSVMKVHMKKRCALEFLHTWKISSINIFECLLNVYGNQTIEGSIATWWVLCQKVIYWINVKS